MIFLIFLALLLLYFSAVYVGCHYPYEKVYWFFEAYHFFGGFLVASFLYNFFQSGTAIVIATFIAGFLWEMWELAIDKSRRLKNFLLKLGFKQAPVTLPDTLLDLFLDTAGALVFVWIFV